MNAVFRCIDCQTFVDPIRDGTDLVSPCCDSIVERTHMCDECGVNEVVHGTDECLQCICNAVIADPRELEQCTAELAVVIGMALAQRLRPVEASYREGCLTRRQAGGVT